MDHRRPVHDHLRDYLVSHVSVRIRGDLRLVGDQRWTAVADAEWTIPSVDDGFGIELLQAVVAGRLSPLQREAFIDVELLHRTTSEVAADMGVTRQYVSQLAATARVKIVRAIGTELAA